MDGVGLVTGDARWPAPPTYLPLGRDGGGAPHTDPAHVQVPQGFIPSLLVHPSIQGQVIQQDIDSATGQCGDRVAVSAVERHEAVPPRDHTVVYREASRVTDQLGGQGPDEQ